MLEITGPDGYSKPQSATTGATLTLSNLPIVSYTFNAPSTTINNVFYTPSVRLQSAPVNAGMTGSVTVTYGVSLRQVNPIIFILLD